jgi:protein TonB
MTEGTGRIAYFDVFTRRNWGAWTGSFLVAAGLNLGLFLLMPHLVDSSPSRPVIDTLVSQVNVIRMKRPDTAVKPKARPPESPKPKPVEKPRETSQQPARPKLTLPFEINPRLPGGPGALVLPPMESAPMADMDFQDAFSVGQLDGPLTPLVRTPPLYPPHARRRGIEGWINVAFTVDETGHVSDITVLQAEPSGLFERSVERCVSGWRFKPGTVEGMPVKARVETTIRFELEQ